MSIQVILMIVAVVLLALSAFGVGSPRVSLLSLGLAIWCLAATLILANR